MIYSALLLGLISSLHCVGMCGPIAIMLPVDRNNPAKKVTQLLTYHLGRISAYASIGLLFGFIGKGFFLAGIQQQLSIFAGVVMIAIILIPERIFAQYNFSKPIFRIISSVKTALGKQFRTKSYKSLFTIGVLNGFLPCGLVYAALFGAIAMQDVTLGMLYMVLFGLGTVPLMSILIYFKELMTLPIRNKVQKAIPYMVVLIGTLFILRGLGLGIPYISPSSLALFVQATPNCHN
ncbi:sulfite exporter TauE/SafE family protein [Flavobacterium sp.]|uniref:sulfite exporter TauE/SafE family protein n=1 Tax=Flavobacterium sp. TaxID=239 RepID=UPI00248A831D|nr:sulfite exporter TauE/SafE family protein [Flavobacterium sp.]MDI1317404.1 sulfite exporter TauE/SafE family protein [Flavobacterium sp.]